ncbi:hypothetical protein LCGC14_2611660 [marine sediment metagenome]|uniref:Uncharacterized protein n=1 Tax=marine sediment metagenome TaxID=412755 RepID=A0A0F9ATC1_9ZZZZ
MDKKLRLPRCPRCREHGPAGLCAAHEKWYADMNCMDCSTPLTDENYAEYIIKVGPAKQPWEDGNSFAVIARTADTVEVVCAVCKQVRLAA